MVVSLKVTETGSSWTVVRTVDKVGDLVRPMVL